MEFEQLVKNRYSVRVYRPNPVEPEKLEKILNAARFAPTAANKQPFQLIIIKTAGKENELQTIYNREWFAQAPLVICGCTIPAEGWMRIDGKSITDVDIAIVMDHVSLAATELGLGTCWIAAFDVAAARKFLRLPIGVDPVILMPVGYPEDQPKPKERKPVDELIRYDHW